MKISVPRETYPGESRTPLTPDSAAKLVKLGAQLEVEAGLGTAAGFADEAYAKADTLAPVDARILADWAEAHVRQVPPGGAVSPAAVAVLQRLEKAEPNNGLALFYLGAADFAQGRKPEAARRWKTLLSLLPPDAPIRGMLEAKIREAE